MKTRLHNHTNIGTPATLVAITTAIILLTACASQPPRPNGSEVARNKLTMLQGNAYLANRAPIEIRDADIAVREAEQSQTDPALTRHLVLIAGQKVDIASAWAQSRFYEDQRKELSAQSEAARLESRTLEANRARSDADLARNQTRIALNDASLARNDTAIAQGQTAAARNTADAALAAAVVAQDQTTEARNQAELARKDTDVARSESADLQLQIAELNARDTDRGLVITLGDVLFETGRSELRSDTEGKLDNLVAFLKRYDNRTVAVEGHTDNVGTASSNVGLSERRAASVQSYLVGRGVNRSRISASGEGETMPIASNDTDTGRQQNRRVEVIISNTTR
jgi:outer membrane protein OmpA-like peptidoglycan-associated protein